MKIYVKKFELGNNTLIAPLGRTNNIIIDPKTGLELFESSMDTDGNESNSSTPWYKRRFIRFKSNDAKCGELIKLKDCQLAFCTPTEEGILWNEEKKVISAYWISHTWFVPEKVSFPIKLLNVERVSLNLETGALYTFYKDKNKRFQRIDWVTDKYNYTPSSMSGDLVKKFAEIALEKMNSPVSVKFSNPSEENQTWLLEADFQCGGKTVHVKRLENIYNMLSTLAVAPNTVIRYDSFKNEMAFRDGAFGEGNANDIVTPYVPILPEFKKYQPKQIMDEGEYINEMCSRLSIPATKTLKKMYRKNPFLMGLVHYIDRIGIKRPDNIMKALKLINSGVLKYGARYTSTISFLRALIKANGESIALKKLNALVNMNPENVVYDISYIAYDTIRMYSFVHNKNRIPVDFTGTIMEIHDKLSVQYNKIKHANRKIEYSAEETKREAEYNGYTVHTAEDTDKLFDIGNKMHICVGSYGDMAVEKKTTIYYITDQNGKYAACIEVKNNKLLQAKGYCNNSLAGDVAEVVKSWVKEKRVASNCSDFENLMKNTEKKKQHK